MTGWGGKKPKRQTWRDWTPGLLEPEELITRDQVLATLERLGLRDISERTLRYWEDHGVLPAPIQRRHLGKTRALYPWWMVDLVWRLKRYQDKDFALAELPEPMRAEARDLALESKPPRRLHPADYAAPTVDLPDDSPLAAYLAKFHADIIDPWIAAWNTPPEDPTGYPFAPLPVPPRLDRDLAVLVSALAYGAELVGFTATGATIVLTDRHGRQHTHPVTLLPMPTIEDRAADPPVGE